MAKTWGSPKDPGETRDYGVNWLPDIGAATITDSVWRVTSGDAVIVSDSHDNTTTTVRVSGGTVAAKSALLTNHVVLSDGEEGEQSFTLKIKER